MSQTTSSNCQFCSVISKAHGEDPIGTAGTHDEWLLVELPQPWSIEDWQKDPQIGPLIALFQDLILNQGRQLRPIAIGRDRAYSRPGYTRVLHYWQPTHRFAQYRKQEFQVPDANIGSLITALLTQPDQVSHFAAYRQPTEQVRDMLVCTHGNVDVACARFGNPLYEQLRQQYATSDADATVGLRVWRCSHFGGHRFAPTLIDLPLGQYWGHLEAHLLDTLVHRHGSPDPLRGCYRGWAGLDQWTQIAEREAWMQVGWRWLQADKAGQVLQQDTADPPAWAAVQIEVEWPDTGEMGVYQVHIEANGEVETAYESADVPELKPMRQYRVRSIHYSSHAPLSSTMGEQQA